TRPSWVDGVAAVPALRGHGSQAFEAEPKSPEVVMLRRSRSGLPSRERTTGIEPATLSLGSPSLSAQRCGFRALRPTLRPSLAREVLLEALCRFGLVTIEQVAVAVGHVRGRMADVVADPLQREACVVHQGDVGVAEFVKADGLK